MCKGNVASHFQRWSIEISKTGTRKTKSRRLGAGPIAKGWTESWYAVQRGGATHESII
jgi:hypothetical protein